MGAAVCLGDDGPRAQRVRSLVLIGPAGIGQKIDSSVIRGLVGGRSREELEPLLGVLYADRSALTDDQLDQLVAYKQRPGVVEALVTIASSRYTGTPSGRQLSRRGRRRDDPDDLGRRRPDDSPASTRGDRAGGRRRCSVLPRCGHMAHVEAADAVNRLIERLPGALTGRARHGLGPVAAEPSWRVTHSSGDDRRAQRELAAEHRRGDDLGELAHLAVPVAAEQLQALALGRRARCRRRRWRRSATGA